MKKKKKPAPKKVQKFNIKVRHSSGDLVEIQISARLKKIPKGLKITREMLSEMIRDKARRSSGQWTKAGVEDAEEGPNPPGIELKIIRWRNPNSSRPGWRSGDQADAWGSLRRVLARA